MSCCEIKETKAGRKWEVLKEGVVMLRTKYKEVAEAWVAENHPYHKPEPVQSPAAPLKASIKPVNVKSTSMP